jgi:hypothetical protein
MCRCTIAALVAALLASPGETDTYRVGNLSNAGDYSLRWAIEQANAHAGRDVIRFAPRLAGKVIMLTTSLPALTGNRTVINGDIDGDGHPDIAINGNELYRDESGLMITGQYCTVRGLAIAAFPDHGIDIQGGGHNTIRSCHIGVNLAGTKAVLNGDHDVWIESSYNTIGGTAPADRNLISGGSCTAINDAVNINSGSGNTIAGNYFGLDRTGMTALGSGRVAVRLTSDANTVGGTVAGAGNVFGGVMYGIVLNSASDCLVAGNYFGLGADGDRLMPIGDSCVVLSGSCRNNTIGGETAAERNTFAGGALMGIFANGTGTEGNRIRGNYFGLNAAGTRQRRLVKGVSITASCGGPAGAQTVGGGRPRAGNYFVLKPVGGDTCGVECTLGGGAGSVIQHNTFGAFPDGRNATGPACGVRIEGVPAEVTDNLLASAESGVAVTTAGSNVRIFRNTFRNCFVGVDLQSQGYCRLGDLGNASTRDDGGNYFRRSNTLHVRNYTVRRIKAEGNDWGTTARSEINAKIIDTKDNPFSGKVDFSPLTGGILPTGETAGQLMLAGLTAVPTSASGAEAVFSLSAPADVTVSILNIAGRTVATVSRDRAADPGLQRIVWPGRSDSGTQAPSGTYLVRVVACTRDGDQASAVGALTLNR